MAMKDGGTYGYKRLVVGAHYGMKDFLVQRMSAVVMALYTVVLLVALLFTSGPMTYEKWAGLMSMGWMKFLTFAFIAALMWHAWVGMVSIWYDYAKPAGLRLVIQLATAIWVVGCLGWALQVLWRL